MKFEKVAVSSSQLNSFPVNHKSPYLQLHAPLIFADHCFDCLFCKLSAQPIPLLIEVGLWWVSGWVGISTEVPSVRLYWQVGSCSHDCHVSLPTVLPISRESLPTFDGTSSQVHLLAMSFIFTLLKQYYSIKMNNKITFQIVIKINYNNY